MAEPRLMEATTTPDEERVDLQIRPKTLAEYVGQAAARERLGIYLQAARQRAEALDHGSDVIVTGAACPQLRFELGTRMLAPCEEIHCDAAQIASAFRARHPSAHASVAASLSVADGAETLPTSSLRRR